MIRASWPTSCSKLPARRARSSDTRQVSARAACDCFADSRLPAWWTPGFEKTCGSTRRRDRDEGHPTSIAMETKTDYELTTCRTEAESGKTWQGMERTREVTQCQYRTNTRRHLM